MSSRCPLYPGHSRGVQYTFYTLLWVIVVEFFFHLQSGEAEVTSSPTAVIDQVVAVLSEVLRAHVIVVAVPEVSDTVTMETP